MVKYSSLSLMLCEQPEHCFFVHMLISYSAICQQTLCLYNFPNVGFQKQVRDGLHLQVLPIQIDAACIFVGIIRIKAFKCFPCSLPYIYCG